MILVVEEVVPSLEVVGAPTVEVTAPGPQGPSAGAAGSYHHVQTIPNATWTIIHNLGFYPQVSVVVGGAEVDADVTWPQLDRVVVNLDGAHMGDAYLS